MDKCKTHQWSLQLQQNEIWSFTIYATLCVRYEIKSLLLPTLVMSVEKKQLQKYGVATDRRRTKMSLLKGIKIKGAVH
jgi:hypothetical protein